MAFNSQQFDPFKVSVVVGGIPMVGFADGTMVTVEYDNDKRSKHVGTDGNGRHILSRDRSGTVTVRLSSYSPTNALLTTLDTADEPFIIAIQDKSSTADAFLANSCTVKTFPKMEKGDTEVPLEWVFQFISGEIIHSGAEV